LRAALALEQSGSKMALPLRVGICAIAKNEADYIEEWLAFHILQGVSHVVLYDNNSTDDTCARARSFASRVSLRIVRWPDSRDGFDLTQRLAYFDGAQRLSRVVDYVAFIDLDEFLFATDGSPLGSVLAAFPPGTAAVAVNQRVFGSASQLDSTAGLVTSRFTLAAPKNHSESHWFKTIARPDRIVGFDTVHSVVLDSGDYVLSDGRPLPLRPDHPGFSSLIPEGTLRLHHYILKSREEFERKKLKWSGQDLSNRYTDEYFAQRDASINEVREACLAAFAARVQALIDSARERET
jgi:hypothetical protein